MRQSIFPVLAPVLALAASALLVGAAGAGPAGDEGDAAAPADTAAACDSQRSGSDTPRCPAQTGVIDRLPDSFFIGGGGVGPQGVEYGGGGERVWVYAAGGASASAGARASARASASASVRVSVGGHTHGRW